MLQNRTITLTKLLGHQDINNVHIVVLKCYDGQYLSCDLKRGSKLCMTDYVLKNQQTV